MQPAVLTSSEWHHVDRTDLMDPTPYLPSRRSNETIPGRIHQFLTVTAAPVAIVLGIFFALLFVNARIEAHTVGRVLASFCVSLCVVMTLCLIYLHLAAFTDPLQQRRIVRILVMVPIYAISSLIALWHHEIAPEVGLLRDCYESYVIYTFYNLLMGYLGGEEQALAIKKNSNMVACLPPLCCFGTFALDRETLIKWKALLVQYMILKPLLAFVAIVLIRNHLYDETSWEPTNAHVYFVFVLNLSVTLAFSSLVYFFNEFKHALQPHKPLGKFIAVKAVVFLTFWQSVVLGLLVHIGALGGSREGLWTPAEVATGIQDFLICLEMLGVCYLHHHVFDETPFIPATGHHEIDYGSVVYLFRLEDVLHDTLEAVSQTVRLPRQEDTQKNV